MGIMSKLFGGGVVEPITAVGNILDDLIESPEEKAATDIIKKKIAQRPQMVQAQINQVQASHRSTFVAGARPFIIWVCGFGLGYAWVVRPIIIDICTALGIDVTFSVMETQNMIDLVIAILGLGAMRMVEKLGNKTK